MTYDKINREERSACAHLFRLLHENLATEPSKSGLKGFLSSISALTSNAILWSSITDTELQKARIYTEVAFLRDLVATRVRLEEVPIFESKEHLCAKSQMKSLLSTKPDLAIAVGSLLLVIEAKLTQRVDEDQLNISRRIAHIWGRKYHQYFGFSEPPTVMVVTLGGQRGEENVLWESVKELADKLYPDNDRTCIALSAALGVLRTERKATETRKTALAELFGKTAAQAFEEAIRSADEDIAPAPERVDIPLQLEYYQAITACVAALLSSGKLTTGNVITSSGEPLPLKEGLAGPHRVLYMALSELVSARPGTYFTGTENLGIRARRDGNPKDVSICTIYPGRAIATFLISRPTRSDADAAPNPV